MQEEKKKMSVIVAYNRIKKSVGRAEKGKEKDISYKYIVIDNTIGYNKIKKIISI